MKVKEGIGDIFNIIDNGNIITTNHLKYLQTHKSDKVSDFSDINKLTLRCISGLQWKPDIHSKFDDIKSSSWFPITELKNNNRSLDIFNQYYNLYNCYLQNTLDNDNTKKEKSANIKKTKLNPFKVGCKFIVTKKVNDIVYGRTCNGPCDHNLNICTEHIDKTQKEYDIMDINVCQHIITQKSRNSDRKGMVCGKFTFDSINDKYCNDHSLRHNEETEMNDTCLRTFHVRFNPTKEQKNKLKTYFGDTRFVYNGCVEIAADGTFTDLRNKYVTEISKFPFLSNTPKEIRAFAVKEYVTNRDNCKKAYEKRINSEEWKSKNFENYKRKNIKNPEMKFRSKKNNQCITVNKDSISIENGKIKIYKSSFSNEPLNFIGKSKKDKRLNKILNKGVVFHDIKIIKTVTNKYYVCFSDDIIKNKCCANNKACAIDTGCRTIGTVYDEQKVTEIGTNMNELLGNLIKEREEKFKKYKEAIKKRKIDVNDIKYNKAKQEYKLINEKIKNKVNDLHYKAINKLVNEYSLIFIPKLNTKGMLEGNTLKTVTKRQLQMERHGKFIARLQEKCEEKKVKCEIVTERMTTKTCSRCFEVNDPKCSETYECSKCNLIIGRDINAAKNIYIQQIAKLIKKLFEIEC